MKNLFGQTNLAVTDARYFKRWFVVLALSIVALFVPAHGETIQKEKSIVTSNSLEQRGKQLRVEIEQAYQKLVDARKLKSGGNDITDVVVRYIPPGMTFDDAEQILRNAGFQVEPRPTENPSSSFPWRYDVIALIDPFVQQLGSKISIRIFLSPNTPGNYDKVRKVYAGITLSTL